MIRVRHILTGMGITAATLLLNACTTTEEKTIDPVGRHFDFNYTIAIDLDSVGSKPLDIWIPIAQSDVHQEIESVEILTDLTYETIVDSEYQNKVLHLFDSTSTTSNAMVQINYSILRYPAGRDTVTPAGERFLLADRLVPINGAVASEADSVVQSGSSPNLIARTLYDHLLETMSYDKSGEGWGNGDALYACDSRQGNCTDIHSLFIGMARSQGLPARFAMGFPIPANADSGKVNGYHCWAEYYLDDSGWLPVDISEAIKNPERKNDLFGQLDANRVTFTIGRDIPLPNGDTLNYLIYPYVTVDNEAYTNFTKSFSYRNK